MVKVDKIHITREERAAEDDFGYEVVFTGTASVFAKQVIRKEAFQGNSDIDSYIRRDIQKGILKHIYGDLYHQVYRIKRLALINTKAGNLIELENRFKELEASISMCEETFKPEVSDETN